LFFFERVSVGNERASFLGAFEIRDADEVVMEEL
jgi:hypothetical protein